MRHIIRLWARRKQTHLGENKNKMSDINSKIIIRLSNNIKIIHIYIYI